MGTSLLIDELAAILLDLKTVLTGQYTDVLQS